MAVLVSELPRIARAAPRKTHRFWHFFVLCLATLLGGPSRARAAAVSEYQVKAAFVYNFAQFIEWPPESLAAKAPLVVAILGDDPSGGALERAVAGKVVNGHPLTFKRFATAGEASACQVLFVPTASQDRFREALQKIGAAGLLTIGEADDFTGSGGVIRFYTEDSKVRFEISKPAVAKSGLKVSAKLMKLAKVVED